MNRISPLALLALIFVSPVGWAIELSDLGNQELAARGLVDASAAPFFADPGGEIDASDAINAAILFARENKMVTYLPAGDYRVSKTIELRGRDKSSPDSGMNDYFCVLLGQTDLPGRRTRIVLAPNSPGFATRNPVAIVVHAFFPDGSGFNYTSHFNQIVRGLDIIIGEGNSGAVGLRMQGAEGCLIEDVTVDATHGWKGVWGIPGSGGSTHRLTVIGGEIGVDLRGFNTNGVASSVGTQPGPTISQLRLINQSQTPLATRTRGSLTIVGAEIRSSSAPHAFTLERMDASQPWGGSLSLVDAAVDLSGGGGGRVLVKQLRNGVVTGRGYTLHNVHVRGVSFIDNASGLTAEPGVWTLLREVAVSVAPESYQGNAVAERIVIDGSIHPSASISDAVADRPPPLDFVLYHGPGQSLPSPAQQDMANLLDFGADPTGATDSTEALRAAIATGLDVFVPKGTFAISDTVYLKSDSRIFGIHPHLSLLLARDSTTSRFAGLPEGAEAVPMLVSPDDPSARTLISMLGMEAPRAARQHRSDPVQVYPLLWQSGRRSVIHHSSFSPYSATAWRLQYVMQQEFLLAQETGNYLNGGLQFSSNDLLGRMFMESLGGSVRLSMPFADPAGVLTIVRGDGQSFDLADLELGKATFGPGIEYAVSITGTRTDNSKITEIVSFGADWTDRNASLKVTLNWVGLKKVEIVSAQPFSLDNLVSSQGTADFERRRPYYVLVACEDMRRGFEHFPFASIRHPQVVIRGHGGGRWYNAFHHGDIWAHDDFSFIRVEDNTEPLNIYHWHLQHVHSASQAIFRKARFVSVFGFKSEHNSRFLSVLQSDHIRLFGWGGLADAAVGGSHFYFEDTPNLLHAAMAEEPHFIANPDVWSSCDNPLVVHHLNLFDGIQESFGGQSFSDAPLSRTILFKRGNPLAAPLIETYGDWTDWMGLDGPQASPGADPHSSGFPNLLRYALGMETDPWTGAPPPISLTAGQNAVSAVVRRPFPRLDVTVESVASPLPGDAGQALREPLIPADASAEDGSVFALSMPLGESSFLWLEPASIP